MNKILSDKYDCRQYECEHVVFAE